MRFAGCVAARRHNHGADCFAHAIHLETRNQLGPSAICSARALLVADLREAIDPSQTVLPQVRPRAPTNIETASSCRSG